MKPRARRRVFLQILKNSRMNIVILAYFVCFLIIAGIILAVEPTIDTFKDSLWYCFVSCSTIGFGDFLSVTIVGRVLTVILYIYTVFMIAILTALFTQFMIETLKAQKNESVAVFLDKLENLEQLSPEELADISRQVKEHRKK